MWIVLNKLLGWQYIEYRDTATSFVARIYRIPTGEWRMKGGFCRDHYDANLKMDGTFVGRNGSWVPLTWKAT